MALKILVVTNQVPFIRGGAEAHAEGLVQAIAQAGHWVEQIRLPFKFYPASEVQQLMGLAQGLNLQSFNGHQVDRVISLLFPAYGVQHPNHVAWVIHQHRAVYDLFNPSTATADESVLQQAITAFDQQALGSKTALYANSNNVAARLLKYNGLKATPLYHPPPGAEHFYCAPQAMPYVYYPSRVESLKRQTLLVQAAALMKSPLKIILSGGGSQVETLLQLIERLGVQQRVAYVGAVSDAEKYAFYANSQAVFFGPQDEDLGYVTLEAMLSQKPVVTCTDSGGPLEFVQHGHTGWVVDPTPQAIAHALDELAANPQQARSMGQAGHAHYHSLGISWRKVVNTLLAGLPGVPAP